uniref:Uncharacterized protein n=1 Tax=Aegilops tauschii subsp. strangulata TaxID=200361 RepID=A0A453GSI6_AEGTS
PILSLSREPPSLRCDSSPPQPHTPATSPRSGDSWHRRTRSRACLPPLRPPLRLDSTLVPTSSPPPRLGFRARRRLSLRRVQPILLPLPISLPPRV